MSAQIIDGTKIASGIREELKAKIAKLKEEKNIALSLVIIRVGDDPASISYVSAKNRACDDVGILSENVVLPENVSEKEIISKIAKLNADPKIHGVLVQMPLPRHINSNKVLSAIDPNKDIDGLHPANLGKLLSGGDGFVPCTPLAILELLKRSGNSPSGKHVVICGRSVLVGKPLALLLLQKGIADATITVAHSQTKNLAEITKKADILVSAVGRPKFITADMVKDGAVVIDVGINQTGTTPEGKRILAGDVDFEKVKERAGAITPVPGGVGPMTVAMLVSNTVKAAEMLLLK